ncbi:MAG: ACT domain-containing protein [Lactobacillales bacterium]|jgi:ACT domain-containing protein|nr:ACT domain-containing protein [Lactobacillales bacterium]
MKAIVTVVGKDKEGIVAGASGKLAELGINILDISQTLFDDYFAMMMSVSIQDSAEFADVKEQLSTFGETIGVKIYIQNAAIFDEMHNL